MCRSLHSVTESEARSGCHVGCGQPESDLKGRHERTSKLRDSKMDDDALEAKLFLMNSIMSSKKFLPLPSERNKKTRTK
jgi:hypothetical protein